MARRTKEDASVTRERLLDAAEQVFFEQGVARASLNEIALRAGTTRGAVYWHFKDKLDLFYAMLERVRLPLEQIASEGQGGLAEVRRIIATVYERLEKDAQTRRVFEVLLHKVEYVGDLVVVQERTAAAMLDFEARLEVGLNVERDSQCIDLPVTAAEAAAVLRFMFDGIIRSWLLSRGGFDLSGVGMRAVDVYLLGLGFALRS